MSNPISKLNANKLQGIVFSSAIGPNDQLVIESKSKNTTFFTFYELSTGELINTCKSTNLTPWHTLRGLDKDGLILSYFENKQNPDKLRFIRYNPQSEKISEIRPPESTIQTFQNYPSLYQPESEHFETVKQFIGEPLVLGCEYEEKNEVIIISYYLSKQDGFERKLLVLKNGKIVVQEVQDQRTTGFAAGGFFTINDRLIFVKEKNEINIYTI